MKRKKTIYLKGFTMAELVVVAAMLLITLTAFLPAFTFVTKSILNNKYKAASTGICSGIIEDIRALDYDAIGTSGGNPSGSIPATQIKSIDGINYSIDTLVSWQSSTGKAGSENNVAFKNVRVIVSTTSPFTNTSSTYAEFNSIFAREGETTLVKAGHFKLKILDVNGLPLSTSTNVILTDSGGFNQSLETDYAGSVLFGIIPAGIYTASIQIPSGYLAPQNETVSGSSIIRDTINVIDWQTTEETVYLDSASKYCNIQLRLVDQATGNVINPPAVFNETWNFESQNFNFGDKVVTMSDYSSSTLISTIPGKLWPFGIYSLQVKGLQGFSDYVMGASSKPKIGGIDWNGTFSATGQTLSMDLLLSRKANFYTDNFLTGILNSTATNGSGALIISQTETQQTLSSVSADTDSTNAYKAFDASSSTYWKASSNSVSLPKAIVFSATSSFVPSSLLVNSKYARNFTLKGSADGLSWNDITSGTFTLDSLNTIPIASNQTYKFYTLTITSKRNSGDTVSIYDIKMKTKSLSASRISPAIPLGFTLAPNLTINWASTLPAGGDLKIYTSISASSTVPGTFNLVSSGASVAQPGEDLTQKYLWIKQELTAGSNGNSPTLSWLNIDY